MKTSSKRIPIPESDKNNLKNNLKDNSYLSNPPTAKKLPSGDIPKILFEDKNINEVKEVKDNIQKDPPKSIDNINNSSNQLNQLNEISEENENSAREPPKHEERNIENKTGNNTGNNSGNISKLGNISNSGNISIHKEYNTDNNANADNNTDNNANNTENNANTVNTTEKINKNQKSNKMLNQSTKNFNMSFDKSMNENNETTKDFTKDYKKSSTNIENLYEHFVKTTKHSTSQKNQLYVMLNGSLDGENVVRESKKFQTVKKFFVGDSMKILRSKSSNKSITSVNLRKQGSSLEKDIKYIKEDTEFSINPKMKSNIQLYNETSKRMNDNNMNDLNALNDNKDNNSGFHSEKNIKEEQIDEEHSQDRDHEHTNNNEYESNINPSIEKFQDEEELLINKQKLKNALQANECRSKDLSKFKTFTDEIIKEEAIDLLNKKTWSPNKFEKYDTQSLKYNLAREYKHIANHNGSFMDRLTFETFKRHTKEKRIEKLISKNKQRISPEQQNKTFNHLIDDANRRLEARENMIMQKEKQYQDQKAAAKKIRPEDFVKYYETSFGKFQKEKLRKISEMKKKQERELEEEEAYHRGAPKVSKLNPEQKNEVFIRNYKEAFRRQLKFTVNEIDKLNESGKYHHARNMTMDEYLLQKNEGGIDKSVNQECEDCDTLENKNKNRSREKLNKKHKRTESFNPMNHTHNTHTNNTNTDYMNSFELEVDDNDILNKYKGKENNVRSQNNIKNSNNHIDTRSPLTNTNNSRKKINSNNQTNYTNYHNNNINNYNNNNYNTTTASNNNMNSDSNTLYYNSKINFTRDIRTKTPNLNKTNISNTINKTNISNKLKSPLPINTKKSSNNNNNNNNISNLNSTINSNQNFVLGNRLERSVERLSKPKNKTSKSKVSSSGVNSKNLIRTNDIKLKWKPTTSHYKNLNVGKNYIPELMTTKIVNDVFNSKIY